MSKSIKHIFALVLALAMVLSVSISASAASSNTTVLKNLPDTFLYIMNVHPIADQGPIAISQATLTENGQDTPIYFVALHGTETSAYGEAVDVTSDLQAGFDKDSTYKKDIIKDIKQDVPAGSNLVLAGHSLGGMDAQRVAADPEIKNNYNVLYVTAIASPLLSYGETEGKVNRLAEKSDAVPYLSHYTFDNMDLQKSTRSEEHGDDYNLFNAHTHSYEDTSVWGNYDAVGNKGGNAVITIDNNTTKIHSAPKYDFQQGKRIYFAFPWDGNNYKGISILY